MGEVGRGRFYGFGELAQMYYPDHNYDSAQLLFREGITEKKSSYPSEGGLTFFIYSADS